MPQLIELVSLREQKRRELLIALKLKSGNGKGIGRKKLEIPVKNVCDALGRSSTVQHAADILGCSKGYIYSRLSPKEIKALLGNIRPTWDFIGVACPLHGTIESRRWIDRDRIQARATLEKQDAAYGVPRSIFTGRPVGGAQIRLRGLT